MPRTPAVSTTWALGERLGDTTSTTSADDDDSRVELADPGQRLLQPAASVISRSSNTVEEQHQQEHAAERSDLRVGGVEEVRVARRVVDGALVERELIASTGLSPR